MRAPLLRKPALGHQKQSVKGLYRETHKDHISENGYVGSSHYGLVHVPVTIQETMRKPRCQSGSEQRMETLRRLPGWDDKNVKSKTSAVEIYSFRKSYVSLSSEERRSCKTPPNTLTASGSPGGHIVKDEGGHKAVFAEQGASAP